ncbi:polycomb group protein Psc-like isoform X2 [Liolophura sinensis]
MYRTTRLKITDLNPHLKCVLCGGYYVDATTIIECLHSFCRTCILRYLETSKFCPICDVMIHKTRPVTNIRADKTLQDLVYKLVPGLYKNEMKRRREYYVKHPDDVKRIRLSGEAVGNEAKDRVIYTEDERISVSLELSTGGVDKIPEKADSNPRVDIRYLQCPAAVTVSHIKKFVRLKYDLSPLYKIDIFHSDEALKDDLTLMDIAYIYTWRRRGPLKLYYCVYENGVKRVRLECTERDLSDGTQPLVRERGRGPDVVEGSAAKIQPARGEKPGVRSSEEKQKVKDVTETRPHEQKDTEEKQKKPIEKDDLAKEVTENNPVIKKKADNEEKADGANPGTSNTVRVKEEQTVEKERAGKGNDKSAPESNPPVNTKDPVTNGTGNGMKDNSVVSSDKSNNTADKQQASEISGAQKSVNGREVSGNDDSVPPKSESNSKDKADKAASNGLVINKSSNVKDKPSPKTVAPSQVKKDKKTKRSLDDSVAKCKARGELALQANGNTQRINNGGTG